MRSLHSHCDLSSLFLGILFVFTAVSASARDVQHAIPKTSVGFYHVYLPDGYDRQPNRRYPVCVLLHGMGSRPQSIANAVSHAAGRGDVIYIAPRAPHSHEENFLSGKPGWRGWPLAWSKWKDTSFPSGDVLSLDVPRLYTSWIAECLADARGRYRIDDNRAIVIGHSEGATYAHWFAYHHPEQVRAYFAHAGQYDYALEEAAERLRAHDVFPVISHCKDDSLQKFSGSVTLVEHFKEGKLQHKAIMLDEGGHKFAPVRSYVRAFVDEYCRR